MEGGLGGFGRRGMVLRAIVVSRATSVAMVTKVCLMLMNGVRKE